VFNISRIALSATPLPIKAELTGSRHCGAAGFSINAYAPVCALARLLLHSGFGPQHMLEVYRDGTLCFQVPLAKAAKLTVKDDKDGVPRFKKYIPFSADRVAPPIAPTELPATPAAPEQVNDSAPPPADDGDMPPIPDFLKRTAPSHAQPNLSLHAKTRR